MNDGMPRADHHTHGVVCAFKHQASRKPLKSLMVFRSTFFDLADVPLYTSETHFTKCF